MRRQEHLGAPVHTRVDELGKLGLEGIAALRAVVEYRHAAVLEIVDVDFGLQLRLVNAPTGRRERLAEMGP